MRARAGTGWQYVMTDLSLILFMITAAALRDAPVAPMPPARPALPAEGEPVAIWRGQSDTSLRQWLAMSGSDPRLQLTLVAPASASAEVLALARAAGRPARVVIEPGSQGVPYAALTYDNGMAHALHR